MFRSLNGELPKIRLHPSTLVDPHFAALICVLARTVAHQFVAYIGITIEALRLAEEEALQNAPPEEHARVMERFEETRKVFDSIGLLGSGPGTWIGRGRRKHRGAGDTETIEAVLEHGDNFIVTIRPRTIPQNQLGAITDIQVLTPGQMMLDAHEQIPDLMIQVMEEHRDYLALTPAQYEDYLHSAGLDHLIPLMQTTS